MKNPKRDFDKEAANWDQNPTRVKLAGDVADAILREVPVTPDMDVLDFGCGTGLVSLRLAPLVKSVIGADTSRGMLEVLQSKADRRAIRMFTYDIWAPIIAQPAPTT